MSTTCEIIGLNVHFALPFGECVELLSGLPVGVARGAYIVNAATGRRVARYDAELAAVVGEAGTAKPRDLRADRVAEAGARA